MVLYPSKKQFRLSKSWRSLLIALAVLLTASGVFFRLSNLNNKIYWLDESFTSLSLSANTRSDLKQELITGQAITKETIHRFQFPNAKTNYKRTIQGLIEDEPQHTPGYFLSARIWLQALGNSIFNVRLFSALVGILCLPMMYLVVLELFEQPIIASMATVFLAVSPFHLLYSQEARPFALWTLTTLVSCYALLKAQKSRSWLAWVLYGFSMLASCYTFLFSLLTYFAHFVYLLFSEKFKLNKNTFGFILSGVITIGGFLPWILILKSNPPSNYTSLPPSSILAYPKAWIRNLSLPFVDLNINESSGKAALLVYLLYVLVILSLIAYSFLFLAQGRKKPFLFLASLIIMPISVLLLRDFGKGGQMTMRANYLIPSLLGIQIMVAYLFSSKIFSTAKDKLKPFWLILTGIVITVAIASCTKMTLADTWWIKDRENVHHELATLVNQSDRPLIVSDVLTDDEFIRPLSLSHYTKANTKFIFFFEPESGASWNNFELPQGYSDIFLYAPSESLQAHLIQDLGYGLKPLFDKNEVFCDCPDEVFFRLEGDKT